MFTGKTLIRAVLALLLVAVVAGGTIAWRQRPVDVQVIEARYSPLVRSLRFSARVETLSRVDVGSTVTGRVLRVLATEGMQVRKDDLLLELESQELSAALAQAQASRQQALARLAGLRSTGRGSVQAALAQAQAAVTAAQAEFERVQQLVAQQFLSASRLDDARRSRDVAAAQLQAARSQVQAVSDTGTDVVQAQAQLQLADAGIAAAQARLAQTRLRAPADAQVLLRQVEPGQIVQPGKALLTLALQGPTRLSAQVDERFLDQLALEQPAAVLADAYPGRRFAARVLSIAPAVDPQRGAIEVKFALVGDAPAFLREDMTLSIEVETGRRPRALVVPVAALTVGADPTRATLRVVQDGRIEQRDVRLGLRTLGAAEVRAGLSEGDEVVLRPVLADGTRVRSRLVEAQLDTAAGAAGAGEGGAAALTNMMGR
ncbi:MAG TPA: efflux RND transporter periplasmic adaptor subunit [Burkholderiaceae bacterium]|nr:efflux RND transporter periplasmic adaptor subunit [Burkholderiaceae bacterium]